LTPEIKLCKFGCGRTAAWRLGRLAGVCEACAPEANRRFVEACRKTRQEARLARLIRCEYRDCDREASVRLFFGVHKNAWGYRDGTRLPGVNYCAEHGNVVRVTFHVLRETQPERHQRTVAA